MTSENLTHAFTYGLGYGIGSNSFVNGLIAGSVFFLGGALWDGLFNRGNPS